MISYQSNGKVFIGIFKAAPRQNDRQPLRAAMRTACGNRESAGDLFWGDPLGSVSQQIAKKQWWLRPILQCLKIITARADLNHRRRRRSASDSTSPTMRLSAKPRRASSDSTTRSVPRSDDAPVWSAFASLRMATHSSAESATRRTPFFSPLPNSYNRRNFVRKFDSAISALSDFRNFISGLITPWHLWIYLNLSWFCNYVWLNHRMV